MKLLKIRKGIPYLKDIEEHERNRYKYYYKKVHIWQMNSEELEDAILFLTYQLKLDLEDWKKRTYELGLETAKNEIIYRKTKHYVTKNKKS